MFDHQRFNLTKKLTDAILSKDSMIKQWKALFRFPLAISRKTNMVWAVTARQCLGAVNALHFRASCLGQVLAVAGSGSPRTCCDMTYASNSARLCLFNLADWYMGRTQNH